MTCEECLVEMETLDTRTVAGSAVAMHSAHCTDCARVLQAITDADRLMMQERDESYYTSNADDVAQRAVVLGQRRGVFAGISVLSVVLLGGSVWYAAMMLDGNRDERRDAMYAPAAPRAAIHTESFEVHCLSNNNVRQLVQPYLTARGSQLQWTDPPLRVLTVKTTADELAQIRDVLKRFDTPANGACSVGDVQTPSADAPDPPSVEAAPARATARGRKPNASR